MSLRGVDRTLIAAALFLVLLLPISARLGQPLVRFPLGENYYRGVWTIYYKNESATGSQIIQILRLPYYTPVEGADLGTFHAFRDRYAVDAHHIFLEGDLYPGDPRHFVSPYRVELDRPVPKFKMDDGRVVSFDKASFVSLGCGYARDCTGVYLALDGNHGEAVGHRVEGVDDATFGVNGRTCAEYDAHGFYRPLASNPFKLMRIVLPPPGWGPSGYETSDEGVTFARRKLEGVDVASFAVYGAGPYAHDREHVFYREARVPEADLATFQPLDGFYDEFAYDAHQAYRHGRALESFQNPVAERAFFESELAEWRAAKARK